MAKFSDSILLPLALCLLGVLWGSWLYQSLTQEPEVFSPPHGHLSEPDAVYHISDGVTHFQVALAHTLYYQIRLRNMQKKLSATYKDQNDTASVFGRLLDFDPVRRYYLRQRIKKILANLMYWQQQYQYIKQNVKLAVKQNAPQRATT